MSKKVIITDMPVEYDEKQYFHTVSAVFEDNKCNDYFAFFEFLFF